MNETVQHLLMGLVDGIAALIPRPRPDLDRLRNCKIISHRGEHDNHGTYENTLAAFAAAREAGVWGIEFDLRWTADLVPVVVHDACGTRVFGEPGQIAELTFGELRRRMPLVPSLADVVDAHGGAMHLMIEIKDAPYPEPDSQKALLEQILSDLAPVRDYHFLSLDESLFRHVDFAPPESWLPVAETNVSELSQWSLDHGSGGLTGHYLLLNNAVRDRHTAAGQQIGTGHLGSRNALFREINRGVEWIFSNNAVAMQQLCDRIVEETEHKVT